MIMATMLMATMMIMATLVMVTMMIMVMMLAIITTLQAARVHGGPGGEGGESSGSIIGKYFSQVSYISCSLILLLLILCWDKYTIAL